jgi:hypothetical protein
VVKTRTVDEVKTKTVNVVKTEVVNKPVTVTKVQDRTVDHTVSFIPACHPHAP